jgi:hypothetical protein
MMKSMLLQRLLHSSSDSNLSKSMTKSDEQVGDGQTMLKVGRLEEKFKQTLFSRLMKPNAVYDQAIIRSIITVIVPEAIAFEEHLPIFRIFTFKVLATLLMTLSFNKSCAPRSLLSEEAEILEKAFT